MFIPLWQTNVHTANSSVWCSQAVISGRESSKWMQALQKRRGMQAPRLVVDVYLEDEEQVDKVCCYLNKVCDSAPQINTCLENIQADRIRLILDVLLPEVIAFIYTTIWDW